jgi:photosystem II stability/assembly factor-like uncharacterized protein
MCFGQKKKKTNKAIAVLPTIGTQTTTASQRLAAAEAIQKAQESSLVKNVSFKNIGPSVMSGRVADLDVNPENSNEFYVAYATGGLWHTTNNGQSFTALFDKQATITLGDVAVQWGSTGPNIWLGTGEPASSRSSYAGLGMYYSANGGKTWEHKGLADSHHIGKVILHPTNPNTLWVAAVGHLYTANAERGVFKTTDSGKTWQKTLFLNENTGAIDMCIDPINPNILYASLWQKERKAWNFVEAGTGSGIYKSTDGGNTWAHISGPGSGFAQGDGNGRIGITASKAKANLLYAVLDNQQKQEPKNIVQSQDLDENTLNSMTKDSFLKLSNDRLNNYLDAKKFPSQYNAIQLKEAITKGTFTIADIVKYTQNANDDLINTPIKGAELYKSTDGGASWQKTHKGYLDAVYNTYGYYFGTVFCSETNPDKVILPGYQLVASDNGGENFYAMNADNVHADHHALWINPKNDKHLILGNDGGINISYDNGLHWAFANPIALGMLYAVQVDMDTPYNVYAGMQDNGVWVGPSTYSPSPGWQSTGHYAYKELLGGDGMQVAVDSRDNNTVYTGFQFGNYYRINKTTGQSKYMLMPQEIGKEKNRFNWQSPLLLSTHNQDIVYLGGQKLFRSLDKGETWLAISADLSKGAKTGDVPFGTITSLSESPLRQGLIYAGTDDGHLQLSTDGGYTFSNISSGLPENLWISRVVASAHNIAKVYVSLNAYRNDDFSSHLYVSDNYGKNWTKLAENLAPQTINVVKEDPVNEQIVYLGTDAGLWLSINQGKDFMNFTNNMANVPVHDLVVHPREHDLLVGTHGRSIYLANIRPIQMLRDSVTTKALYIFPVKTLDHNPNWGRIPDHKKYDTPKPEKFGIQSYSSSKQNASIYIQTRAGYVLNTWQQTLDAGLNFLNYDLSISPKAVFDYTIQQNTNSTEVSPLPVANDGKVYIRPGRYIIKIVADNATQQADFEVKAIEKKSKR